MALRAPAPLPAAGRGTISRCPLFGLPPLAACYSTYLSVGLHTPMQRQLRAYPYAYTLLPLYYISTSLSHWLSWPLGSNRLWASVARTFKVGDWESSWLFWTLPDHPQARIQLFRRLDGADRI